MKTQTAMLMAAAFCGLFTAENFAFAQTWTLTSAPAKHWWNIASSADGTKLVAVTAWGVSCEIYTSTNSGLDWTSNTVVPMGDSSVASSADGSLLAVAGNGRVNGIYISTNSGASWRETTNAANNWWSSVATSADGRKLVALGLSPEEIVTSTNFGATWTKQTGAPILTGQSKWGTVASSADGTRLVAAPGNGGMIYTSTNSGVNWISNLYNRDWWCVASSANGTTLAAGSAYEFLINTFTNYASIYTSTNSGATWTTNVFPDAGLILSLACSADGTKMVASAGDFSSDTILLSTNSGATWTTADSPIIYWHAVCASADGGKLAAVANSVNGGYIWVLQSTTAPQLQIAPGNNFLNLAWTVPSTNFVIQQSPDLQNWADMTNQPVLNLANLQNEVILRPPGSNVFYRLKTP